ncbi:MAG: DUF962 domain-containing protein [Deltaproteobacteria bacterium]|nr:DUF962 domain-containing protein [Deltaproteobacteria bacterium]
MTEPKARIQTFEAFWPYYLREHGKASTRLMHWIGTNLAVLTLVNAVVIGRPLYALWALIPGYGFAWVSHFFIEKNRPATFTYPLWSLIGDFKMWGLMWTGRIRGEVERHVGAGS